MLYHLSDTDLFLRAAKRLFGDQWGNAFDLNPRTVQRLNAAFAGGETGHIPPSLMQDLEQRLRGAAVEFFTLADGLEARRTGVSGSSTDGLSVGGTDWSLVDPKSLSVSKRAEPHA